MAKKEKLSKRDLKLVNDLNAAMQEETHYGLWLGVLLLASLMVVFIYWAYNSELEEVTVGQGSIIPSSRQQMVQSLDGGILKSLEVREGQVVKQGDILVTLDDTRYSAILAESEAKMINLEAMVARYTAEAYGTELEFPDNVGEDLRKREMTAYKARKAALEDTLSGLHKSKQILDEQIRRTTIMVQRGVSSEIELLRMQQQSTDIALKISETQNRYTTEANDNLVRTAAELAQARENVARNADPVARAVIYSPVDGIVNNVKFNTIGGVVRAGEDIMEIVPIGENLLVQAYIRPQDVAFIRPGQEAVVKLSAYDYSVYGGLEGVVTHISPDTLQDDRRPSELHLNANESYYRVLVETNDSKLTDKNGEELEIIPGMVATVDIKTGKKSVFEYLIRPVTRMKQALRER